MINFVRKQIQKLLLLDYIIIKLVGAPGKVNQCLAWNLEGQ